MTEIVNTNQVVDSGTAVQLAKHYGRRFDRWENKVSRFGGPNDPMTITEYQPGLTLSRGQLDSIYEFDWISGKIIDIPPADATRRWVKFIHADDPDAPEVARKETDRWNLRAVIKEAFTLARHYGGSLLVMGAFDGGDVSEPLDVSRIRDVQWMHVVDRYMSYPMTFDNDPMSATFGEVETYQIHRMRVTGVQTMIVHASRVIRFDGRYLPPLRRIRNFGWQNPILTRLYEVIRQFGVSTQSGAATLQDQVIKKIRIKNLQDLQTSGQWDIISTRLALMASEMSINNLMVYGEDEEVEKMGTPINQLPKLMEMFIDYVSAAADIPRGRLFHNMSGSLGGDAGKNDLRIHYDNIEAIQETELRFKVQTALDMLMVPLGYEPGEIGFTWNQLWQMTDDEKADVGLKVAQKDEIYIRSGVVEPEEVAMSRFSGEEPDMNQMTIDVDRREQALNDLKGVDLIKPEPTFEEQLELNTAAQLALQGQEPDEGDDDDPERKDGNNLTSQNGDRKHRHTFDADMATGNGQTIDTLDDVEPHVHMIRGWKVHTAGADDHVHNLETMG